MPNPVYILNGPNLNLLGTREPEIYGRMTLADAENLAAKTAQQVGLTIVAKQSNHEGDLIDWIQEARAAASAIILNAGALTHTSVALYDALKAFKGPIIEVHISNPFARESFRHHSYVSLAATGVICGLGIQGYALAVQAVAQHLQSRSA